MWFRGDRHMMLLRRWSTLTNRSKGRSVGKIQRRFGSSFLTAVDVEIIRTVGRIRLKRRMIPSQISLLMVFFLTWEQ